jgi:CRISPR/Cas system CSM-associated protein Csm2 small subunit
MTSKQRQQVYEKYDGKCAYTGKLLESDWQVDHVESRKIHKYRCMWNCGDINELREKMKSVDNLDNLLPALRIVNHYKRSRNLEEFRKFMLNFHKRLAKLPKTTRIPSTLRRKEYMQKVADAFGLTTENPFSGVFYFETINK